MVTSIFDLQSTVTQIINLERQTLDLKIEENQKRQDEIADLDSVKSKLKSFLSDLEDLQDNDTFETKSTDISDTSIVSASSETGAAEIQFQINVGTLAEAAQAESSANIFSDNADYKGTKTTITGGEVNGTGDLDPNALVISDSEDPNFEGGGDLTEGSFVINDATILVTSSDTVNTILTKISNSSANVTAYYDDTADKIVLEHNEIGDQYDIELSSDSTNFFSKLKLTESDYTKTTGVDADLYRPLADTELGDTITEGYFTINNRTFYVDPASDSLNTVIQRINSSSAGVSIFYSEDADSITLTSDVEGESITMKNDTTSSFLTSTDLLSGAEQTVNGSAATVTINGTIFNPSGNEITLNGTTIKFLDTGDATVTVNPDNERFTNKVKALVDSYNDSAGTIKEVIEKEGSTSSFLYRLMTSLRNKLQGSISNTGTYNYLTDIGITFSRGITGGQMQLDEDKFNAALDSERESVTKLFSYDDNSDGLRTDGGLAVELEDFLEEYTKGTLGFLDERKEIIGKVIDRINVTVSRQEQYFVQREANLLNELFRTQELLQQMQNQFAKASSINTNLQLITGGLI